jgi:DNA-binding Lrp family transcriptional regulator
LEALWGHSLSDPREDQWVGWGNGLRVWHTLRDDEPTTVRQLSDATGLSAGGMRRILGRLEADDLVKRDGAGGWYRLLPWIESMQQACDRRRDRHVWERVLYRRWLAEQIRAFEEAQQRVKQGENTSERIAVRPPPAVRHGTLVIRILDLCEWDSAPGTVYRTRLAS